MATTPLTNASPHTQTLRLQWPEGHRVSYGMLIEFAGDQGKNEVKYQVDILRLKPNEDGVARFQINRTTDVYVNETVPDLLADQLAYEAGKVYYPLVINVDHNGGFDSIDNHQQILQRWPSVKSKILSNFEGDLVERYLKNMESLIAYPMNLSNAFLKNDWLINILFKPIYKRYQSALFEKPTFHFPITKENDGYTVEEKLADQPNDFGGIDLWHSGSLDQDHINQVKGIYQAQYILHPRNKQIISFRGEFLIQDTQIHQVKIKLFVIPEKDKNFDDDFELNETDHHSASKLFVLDGPPQKSFWKRLLNN